MALATIMANLAAALLPISGLRVYPYPSDSVEAPAVALGLPDVGDLTFKGGSYVFMMPVWLFVSKASDRMAASEIVQYIDPRSIRSIQAAIELYRTLGGACDSVSVTSVTPQIASVAGTEYLAVEYTLEVIG